MSYSLFLLLIYCSLLIRLPGLYFIISAVSSSNLAIRLLNQRTFLSGSIRLIFRSLCTNGSADATRTSRTRLSATKRIFIVDKHLNGRHFFHLPFIFFRFFSLCAFTNSNNFLAKIISRNKIAE